MRDRGGSGLVPAPEPLGIYRCVVRGDWLDSNGHVTAARYSGVFLDAGDLWLRDMGLGPDYATQGYAIFTGDMHVTFVREVPGHATLTVTSVVTEVDARRFVLHQDMTLDGEGHLAATAEQMFINVDTVSRRTAPFPEDVLVRLEKRAGVDVSALRNVGRRVALTSGAPER